MVSPQPSLFGVVPLSFIVLSTLAFGCTTPEYRTSPDASATPSPGETGEVVSDDPCGEFCAQFDWTDGSPLEGVDEGGPVADMFFACNCNDGYPFCNSNGTCPTGTFETTSCASGGGGYFCEDNACVLTCGEERLSCDEASELFNAHYQRERTCDVDSDCVLSAIGSRCGCGTLAVGVGANTDELLILRAQERDACRGDLNCDCAPTNEAYCDEGLCLSRYNPDAETNARDQAIQRCRSTCAEMSNCSILAQVCSEDGANAFGEVCDAYSEDDRVRPDIVAEGVILCRNHLEWAISTFELEQECDGRIPSEDPDDECIAVCARVASCEELTAICSEDAIAEFHITCNGACQDPDLRLQVLAAGSLDCATVSGLVVNNFGLEEDCEQ